MAWLLVLLMPLTLFGQYTFGPVRLDDGAGDIYGYSHVRTEPDGGLICTWAWSTDSAIAAYGQRMAPDGSLVGEPICYEYALNDGFACGAAATIIRRDDGREGQLLNHPWNDDIYVRFYSPEGQLTDSLARENAASPRLCELGDGWFLAYTLDNAANTVLIWMDANGHVVREQVEGSLTHVTFVYTEGDSTRLVEERHLGFPGYEWQLIVHSFLPGGECAGRDTIATFAAEAPPMGMVYAAQEGSLMAGYVECEGDSLGSTSYARIVRHGSEGTEISDRWVIPVTQPENWFVPQKVAFAPYGGELLGGSVGGGEFPDYQICAFDTSDALCGSVCPVTPVQDQTPSGLDLVIAYETVYMAYSFYDLVNSENGGSYVLGFPLSEIMSGNHAPVATPSSFRISAYPNPFNAVTQLSFDLPRAGAARISITDILGRQAAVLGDRVYTAGSHSVTFDARDLASGIYFATLRSGSATQTQKLVLLK